MLTGDEGSQSKSAAATDRHQRARLGGKLGELLDVSGAASAAVPVLPAEMIHERLGAAVPGIGGGEQIGFRQALAQADIHVCGSADVGTAFTIMITILIFICIVQKEPPQVKPLLVAAV